LQADYGSKLQFHGLRLDLRTTFFMRNAARAVLGSAIEPPSSLLLRQSAQHLKICPSMSPFLHAQGCCKYNGSVAEDCCRRRTAGLYIDLGRGGQPVYSEYHSLCVSERETLDDHVETIVRRALDLGVMNELFDAFQEEQEKLL